MYVSKELPFYNIGQVAEILNISSDRLRTYDEEKIVFPYRVNNNRRLYSEFDIEWLRNFRLMIIKHKININSLKLILKLASNISDKKIENLNFPDEITKILIKMKKNPNFKKFIKI